MRLLFPSESLRADAEHNRTQHEVECQRWKASLAAARADEAAVQTRLERVLGELARARAEAATRLEETRQHYETLMKHSAEGSQAVCCWACVVGRRGLPVRKAVGHFVRGRCSLYCLGSLLRARAMQEHQRWTAQAQLLASQLEHLRHDTEAQLMAAEDVRPPLPFPRVFLIAEAGNGEEMGESGEEAGSQA